MNRFVSTAAVSVAFLLLTAGPLQASLIPTVGGHAAANASSAQGSSSPLTFITFPDSHVVTANVIDGTTATTSVNLFELNGSTTISFGFDHERTGLMGEGSFAQSNFFMTFTALANSVYTISGYYDLNGTNYVDFAATLNDVSASSDLFKNQQSSDHTPQQQFVLGGAGGDLGQSLNFSSGSLQGNLIAGHQYFLSGSAFIQAFNFTSSYIGDDGATASGNVTLRIDAISEPPSAVPEPSSLALFGIGAGVSAFGAFRRRRSNDRSAA